MLKQMTAALVAVTCLFGSALAQDTVPTSTEDCGKMAADLVAVAESKTLSDERLDKIEELLVKMEGHCDAQLFAEAATVAKEIRTELDRE